MNLTPQQFERLKYLLGKAQQVPGLAEDERREFRWLLSHENPRMREYPWDRVLDYAFTFVGTHLLFRDLGAT